MNKTAANRVPHILFLYWVIKIASTTLGETGADMFSMTFNLGYGTTIAIFMISFLILLAVKLSIKGYEPVTYWLTFTASAIVGTALSDYIDRTLGFGYMWGSLLLMTLLMLTLAVWHKKEKSINVEYVPTLSMEIFYWIAFLIANTLGTAAGDLLADDLGFGFMTSALIISALLGGIALLHFFTKVSGTLLFWLAFVLTRPFGATFGDLMTKTHEKGGLNLGTVGSSLFFSAILIMAVAKESQQEKRRKAA
jgi:uncharacterized membrane-anchored protein